jgi:seryl-tRNA synthetase
MLLLNKHPTLPKQLSTVNHLFNFKQIVANKVKVKANAIKRKSPVDVDKISELYTLSVKQQYELSSLAKLRNLLHKSVLSKVAMTEEGLRLKSEINEKSLQLKDTEQKLFEEAKHLPNETDESVPIGAESFAKLIYKSPIPIFNFKPKTHLEICETHDMLDIDRAGKVSGTGSYYLKNAGALFEFALTRYAIDICTKEGFTPVITPDIIKHGILDKCGFSPRSLDPQTYFLNTSMNEIKCHSDDELILAATAEFPLAGMHSNETIERNKLPLKFVGMGHAFRAEGFGGLNNRGLILFNCRVIQSSSIY